MPDTEKNTTKVPEFLREPLEAAQARLESFEEEAQKVFKDLLQKGRESRKDFAVLVQRISAQDGYMDELRGRVGKLKDQGKERAQALRGKAETVRVEAVERLELLQSKAITYLGVATREQVEELSRELEKLVRRLDRSVKQQKAAKRSPKRA
ncbi:MAG: hypothetical protein ACJ79R_06820 [Anaeromyxobacteraceae bacterium]